MLVAANKEESASGSALEEVADKEGFAAATSGAGLTVVDYWAPWCKNCKKISPVLARLSTELGAAARFVKVNTQDAEALAAEQGVDALPFLQFFKGGKLVGSFKGLTQFRCRVLFYTIYTNTFVPRTNNVLNFLSYQGRC